MEQLRWKRWWWSGGALLIASVLWLSLMPAQGLPGVGLSDKAEHALGYGMLATWFSGLVVRAHHLGAGIALFAFGVGCELLQHFGSAGRSGEVADALANGVGVAVAVVIARFMRGSWMRSVERRLGARP
jgi:VanZ family protein